MNLRLKDVFVGKVVSKRLTFNTSMDKFLRWASPRKACRRALWRKAMTRKTQTDPERGEVLVAIMNERG